MGLLAKGYEVQRGDGASPEAFTKIPGVVDVSGPGGEAPIVDMTDLDSTAAEKAPGLPDEGQLQLTVNWEPKLTQHAGLFTDRSGQTLRNFRLVLTDASPKTTYAFAGYVTGIGQQVAVNDKITAQVTIEISGAVSTV